jgi:hypothetical protein
VRLGVDDSLVEKEFDFDAAFVNVVETDTERLASSRDIELEGVCESVGDKL